MKTSIGYICSEALKCDIESCPHNRMHLIKRLAIWKGQFITCANQAVFCKKAGKYVICSRPGVNL